MKRVLKNLLGLALFAGGTQVAYAQAWTPEARTLSVDGSYQLGYGEKSENIEAPVTTHAFIPDVEYGVTDEFALSLSLPLVFSKADAGTFAHGSWDDGNYHGTPTDVRLTARYMIPVGFLAITPQIGGSIPVRDYEVRGFAAAGRHLKAGYVGINLGADLDEYIPRTNLHLAYEFALVEKFTDAGPEGEGFSQNFSTVSFLVGHNIGRVQLHAGVDYRHNHGGIRFDDFGMITMQQRMFHDGLLVERIVLAGGGLGYSVSDTFGLYANFRIFAWGENTHDSSLFALGASWDYAL